MAESRYYVLRDGQPVPAGLLEWAKWFETNDRSIARDEIAGDVAVSTVFLGAVHPGGIYETMIFGGPEDGFTLRAWDDATARANHAKAMARARRGQAQDSTEG